MPEPGDRSHQEEAERSWMPASHKAVVNWAAGRLSPARGQWLTARMALAVGKATANNSIPNWLLSIFKEPAFLLRFLS